VTFAAQAGANTISFLFDAGREPMDAFSGLLVQFKPSPA